MLPTPRWTPEEEDQIRRRWATDPTHAIAIDLGRTNASVLQHGRKLGLGRKPIPHRSKPEIASTRRHWTDEEDGYIQAHWATDRLIDIGSALNRPDTSISLRGKHLGLGRKPNVERLQRYRPRSLSAQSAWVAGIFDAHGHINIKKSQVALVVSGARCELEDFIEATGFGKIQPEQTQVRWVLYRRADCLKLVEMILPYSRWKRDALTDALTILKKPPKRQA